MGIDSGQASEIESHFSLHRLGHLLSPSQMAGNNGVLATVTRTDLMQEQVRVAVSKARLEQALLPAAPPLDVGTDLALSISSNGAQTLCSLLADDQVQPANYGDVAFSK